MYKFKGLQVTELLDKWNIPWSTEFWDEVAIDIEDYISKSNDGSAEWLEILVDVRSYVLALRNNSRDVEDGYEYLWDGLLTTYDKKLYTVFLDGFLCLLPVAWVGENEIWEEPTKEIKMGLDLNNLKVIDVR